MVTVTKAQIQALAPHALPQYIAVFDDQAKVDNILRDFEINTNQRVAHFFAQVLHETDGLTILRECMNYTHAQVICDTWPSRFHTLAEAQPFTHNPQALANKVYGGRMGNVAANDGWVYRGGGWTQVTGLGAYRKRAATTCPDILINPDLVCDTRYCFDVAADDWVDSGCNELADDDDIRGVTQAINGGLIGFDDRKLWLTKTKPVWPY